MIWLRVETTSLTTGSGTAGAGLCVRVVMGEGMVMGKPEVEERGIVVLGLVEWLLLVLLRTGLMRMIVRAGRTETRATVGLRHDEMV